MVELLWGCCQFCATLRHCTIKGCAHVELSSGLWSSGRWGGVVGHHVRGVVVDIGGEPRGVWLVIFVMSLPPHDLRNNFLPQVHLYWVLINGGISLNIGCGGMLVWCGNMDALGC